MLAAPRICPRPCARGKVVPNYTLAAARRCTVRPASASHLEVACPLHPDVQEVLFSEEAIQQRVDVLGRQLAAEYHDKQPVVLGVLKGAFVFTADLVRSMQPVPDGLYIDFIRASSYGNGANPGDLTLNFSVKPELVKNRHILLVEDIIDTGVTLQFLQGLLLKNGAASVKLVAFLDKVERRKAAIHPDYVGFECPNEFVVGYGLDFAEKYRSLPFIGILKREVYGN